MELIKGTTQYGIDDRDHIKTLNKNMTYTSILAAFKLILATNKNDFKYFYKLAMHDNSGGTTWNMMQSYKKSYAPREVKHARR